jgi:hypothetical protein
LVVRDEGASGADLPEFLTRLGAGVDAVAAGLSLVEGAERLVCSDESP